MLPQLAPPRRRHSGVWKLGERSRPRRRQINDVPGSAFRTLSRYPVCRLTILFALLMLPISPSVHALYGVPEARGQQSTARPETPPQGPPPRSGAELALVKPPLIVVDGSGTASAVLT